jgi:two-component system response regulator (stage 0 sporulation protein A)
MVMETVMENNLHAKVSEFAIRVGCPSKYTGYYYFRDAIYMMLKNDIVGFITKTVYGSIATQHSTDISNVERCIRTLADRWWNSDKCGSLFKEKPTNRELLYTCAELIRFELLKEGTAEDSKGGISNLAIVG